MRLRPRLARPHIACLHLMLTGLALAPWAVGAESSGIAVLDDLDREVVLEGPAQRVISLAPNLTENLFAVGAGDQLVGVVSYSDYPEAAKEIQQVGSFHQLDMERIVALQPDLVVAWVTGGTRRQAERLEALGHTVFYSEPRTFDDIADTLERLGTLTGNDEQGRRAARALRDETESLRARYSEQAPVTVFYQVWDQPLMTVSDEHLIGRAIQLCGGSNVFSEVDALIPRIDRESVLKADPEVIVAGGMGEENRGWLEAWRKWPRLHAVRSEQLVFIPPSLIQRHTPRALQGTRMLCEALDHARQARE